MKSLLRVLFILCYIMNTEVFAQDVEKLPDDPRVKTGTLANGLSYILIKNKAEKGYAHFGIAQTVGTTLEEADQKGMFKMLEALTIKGTRNFTDSTITLYLKSKGVTPQDVSFTTREDDITYLIKNMSVSNDNTVDSSLLILYNWLNSINIDEEDIKGEIPFVKNRLLYDWDASKRLDDRLINELYPRSRYAMNLQPSDIKQIDNFTSKEVRNFYYKWFRPDFQAVIVVGDIDLDRMETKVKSIFATIPKPLNNQSRTYYTPKPFDGVKVSILKDKEYNKTSISIDILKEPLSAKYKLTSVPFIQEYMDGAISKLLLDRLREGIVTQNLPVSNLNISKGRFMNIRNQDAFSITFETLPNRVYSAIAFVNAEIGRMAKHGFNNQEFHRSREIYFRELENKYDNRTKLGNDEYLERALNHYYNGFSLASIELKFEIMKEILFTITLSQLNKYAYAMLGQEDNIVISCRMPEYEGIEGITKERILTSYRDAGLKTPSIQPDATVIAWPEFVRNEPVGKIISEVADPVTGATVLMLSNGATVILKKTYGGGDTISFKAVSKGGFSLMRNANFGNEQYINEILNLGGLGNISQSNIERLFSYYNLNLDAKIRQNTEELEGHSDKVNLEKLFHAIYLSMTERRADEVAYDVYKKGKIFETAYRSLSPGNAFKDSILYYSYSNKNYIKRVEKEDVEKMEYSDILYQTRARFSNAADFVFIFTGDIDELKCKEYAVKYIGSIPGNVSEKEDWQVAPNYLSKKNIDKRFLFRMINPRTYVYLSRSYGMAYNLENYILSSMTGMYLKNIFQQRKNERFITIADIEASLKYYPEGILTVNTVFETDSLHARQVDDIIDNHFQSILNNGMDSVQFGALVQKLKEQFLTESVTNKYWLNIMEQRYIMGKDFHNNYMKTLESITPSVFRNFIYDLINKGNKITIIMDGTTQDVNTQNLFKKDEFIKEFFEIN